MASSLGNSVDPESSCSKKVDIETTGNENMACQRSCDLCIACDEHGDASGFCEACHQYFCESCKIEHTYIPAAENHIFLSVEEGILLENTKKPINCGLCDKLHKESKASKLCIECNNLLLCDRCSRKHSANTATSFHTMTEDLTLHTGNKNSHVSLTESGLFDQGASTSGISEISDSAENEAKYSVIKPETEYYIRFILLLIKGGSRILRKILDWGLERRKTSLNSFLTSNKTDIRKSKHIKREQIQVLYPDPSTNSDTKKWDIQLLCFITIEYFSNELNTPEKTAVKKIREMRNDFHAHYPHARIDRNTFYLLWSELSLIMTTLGRNMTESEREKNNKLISSLCSTKLDMNSATEEIKILHSSDELLDTIQQNLNDVLGMNLVVKQDLSEIKDALADIKATLEIKENHEKFVKTVYGAVHVRAKKQSIVDKAEAELLAASKKSVNGTDMLANSKLTERFDKFKEDIEETGVEIEDTNQGSIIFKFKSHSVSELLALIDLFESPRMQMHMDNISRTLQTLIGESLQLTAYILRDSLLEALRQMGGTEHKKTVWLSMTCTGIEGLQHALKIFEEDGASNTLNEMSTLLSESIGDTVTLESSIDMDELQRVIITTREQLASSAYSKRSLLISEYRAPDIVTEREERSLRAIEEQKSGEGMKEYKCQYGNAEKMFKDRPGKPIALNVLSDTVTLSWNTPLRFGKEDYYQIYYTTDVDDRKCKWTKYPADPQCPTATLTELRTKTTFIFRVRAVYDNEDGPYSPRSDEITTTESLALRLLQDAKRLEDVNISPAKYRLPMSEIASSRNELNKTKKCEIGVTPKGYVKSKTILLVGATGTGKSTLVDGIANYALGVNWEDTFRFTAMNLEEHEIIRSKNQALSQTDWITCYTINQDTGSRLRYQLNVIDTPGFGDTAGPTRDQQIADQLRKLFKEEKEPKGVTYIDAACFLIKSSDARLTVFQEYIFKSVMALFGKDMESNICYFITFADNKTPPVLAAMKETGLPKGDTFIFNNSGLFETNISNDATNAAPLFWKMGLQSFQSFFEYLERAHSKSLQQTKAVLEERYVLEEAVSNMQPLLDLGLSKVYGLKQEIKILEENFNTIKDNQNFEYEVEESQRVKRQLPDGQHATICMRCNFTCHDTCTYGDKSLKSSCCAMDSEGKCKVCPDKCDWTEHENTTYKLDYVLVKVRKQYQNMRRKFDEASGKVVSQEQVIHALEKELQKHSKEIEYFMFVVKSCTDKLSDIALRPNPLNMAEYIVLMIENEKYEKKGGFQKRIRALKDFRRKAGIQKEFEKFSEEASGILETVGQKRIGWFRSAFERAKTWLS